MTAAFDYFSTTRPDSLASGMSNSDTTVVLADGSTFPEPVDGVPYTVIIGFGTSREEICTVTDKPSSTTLTVIRGEDGTPATAKNPGDTVVHGVSAREFRAMNGKLDSAGGTVTGDLQVDGDLGVGGDVAADTATIATSATVAGSPVASEAYADGKVVDNSTGSSTTEAMSQAAGKAYADAKVANSATGGSTTVAPSQAAAKSYADGKVVNAVGTSTTSAMSQNAAKTYIDSRIWTGTQAQYDAISVKDPTVLYVITG